MLGSLGKKGTGWIFWRIVAFKSIHKFRAPRLGRPLFIQQQPPQPLSLPQPVLMPLPQLQNRISRMMIQHILPPKKPQLLLHIKNTSKFFDAVLPLIPWYSGRRKMCGHSLRFRFAFCAPFVEFCRYLSISFCCKYRDFLVYCRQYKDKSSKGDAYGYAPAADRGQQ